MTGTKQHLNLMGRSTGLVLTADRHYLWGEQKPASSHGRSEAARGAAPRRGKTDCQHPSMSEPTVITLGCRLNACESEAMRGEAAAAGLGNTVIVNTCAVTAEAVRQSLQTIRRVRRERPDARVVVTGCAAQVEPERFARLAEVDHVIGNGET